MRRKIDKSLLIPLLLFVGLVFAAVITNLPRAFAEDPESDYSIISDFHHITIYDNGEKLSLKSDAKTVAELLSRAEITLLPTDSVEPSLDSEINADNFFINIYRSHPALVVDGNARKYLMTSSFDPKSIAREAGFNIYDGDSVSLAENSNFLELGAVAVYEIVRGDASTLTITEEVPFEEIVEKDYTIPSGSSSVFQLGEVGERTLIYKIKTVDGVEVSRELVSEKVTREPVARITHVGADWVIMKPLTASMGRNRYTVKKSDGSIIERQETYYDLDMSRVMKYRQKDGCGDGTYSVREDGVKVDNEGYILVAANLDRYPLCSVVETSLGTGKVYDTGSFASVNPEQFDIATDWTKRNGV